MNEELICQLYETSIKLVKIIDQLSIENNMLDDQHYLCFKDSLNSLSLDPDRPDTPPVIVDGRDLEHINYLRELIGEEPLDKQSY